MTSQYIHHHREDRVDSI